LLDRIDIHIEVPSMEYREIAGTHSSEDSKTIRERIVSARARQQRRFAGQNNLLNARMSDRQLKAHCLLDEDSRQLIEMAVDKLGLSVRAYTRILKVARTIADLEDANNIEASHIAEAIQYRSLDRRTI
jgi:magnesium chelatase family protein